MSIEMGFFKDIFRWAKRVPRKIKKWVTGTFLDHWLKQWLDSTEPLFDLMKEIILDYVKEAALQEMRGLDKAAWVLKLLEQDTVALRLGLTGRVGKDLLRQWIPRVYNAWFHRNQKITFREGID